MTCLKVGERMVNIVGGDSDGWIEIDLVAKKSAGTKYL